MENIIKKYRSLDDHGKKNVDTLLDSEFERCEGIKKAAIKEEKTTTEILEDIQKNIKFYSVAHGGERDISVDWLVFFKTFYFRFDDI